MSLLQRFRTPFSDTADDGEDEPQRRNHAVGEILRDRREELELDLTEVGEVLCIRPAYLAAIEQGRPQDLPGPTYAIGFIRAYADYLGLDGGRVLDLYKTESSDAHLRPDLALPVPLEARSLPGGPILLVGIILALCGYGTWYYLSTGEHGRPERVSVLPAELQQQASSQPQASGPGSAAAKPATGTSTLNSGLIPPPDLPTPGATNAPSEAATTTSASPAPAPATNTPPGTPPRAVNVPAGSRDQAMPATASTSPGASPAGAVPSVAATPVVATPDAAPAAPGINIRAVADCWIQVRSADDQSIVFSRVLKAGETYHVPRTGLFLRTGNAGALTIAVDGKAAPTIGGIGALRRNVSLDPSALLAGTAVKG
ncbi:MAG TPA: RodZ domain-containing protein [Stellaceae bacterium]|nr:RodZ domain-containing protein [Stellaceae bacterium]